MKMFKFSIVIFLFFLMTSPLHAKNYYVCDTGGDDNNSGLSKTAPLKSAWSALDTFNKMDGGDSLLFCRGGKFPAPHRNDLYNKKCSASNVCTIAAYGVGNRPEIFSTGNNAALHFSNRGDPAPNKGYLVRDLVLLSDGSTLYGVQFINDVDDVTLDNLHIQGFSIGVYSAGTNTVTSTNVNGTNDRIVLRNSTIINNEGQGWLGGGVGVLIENNTFENNGFGKAVYNHNIYLSGKPGHVTSDVIVRGNTLYKSAFINGQCQGVSLVGHGLMNNVLIENNIIKEDEGTAGLGCWGIAVDIGYAIEEEFNNLTIRNNIIQNVGGLAIGCSSCVDVSITGNTISDPSGSLKTGVAVPDRGEDSSKSRNVNIANNTVLLGGNSSSGVRVGGSNLFTVVNNKIDQPAASYMACIDKKFANSNLDVSSNNCIKHTSNVIFNQVVDDANVNIDPTMEPEISTGGYATDDGGAEQVSEIVIERSEEVVIERSEEVVIEGSEEVVIEGSEEVVIEGSEEVVIEGSEEVVIEGSEEVVIEGSEEVVIEGSEEVVIEGSEEVVIEGSEEVVIEGSGDVVISEPIVESAASVPSTTREQDSELEAVSLDDYQCTTAEADGSWVGGKFKEKKCSWIKKGIEEKNIIGKCRAVSEDGRCLLR